MVLFLLALFHPSGAIAGPPEAASICQEARIPAMGAYWKATEAYNKALRGPKDQIELLLQGPIRKRAEKVFELAKASHLAYLKKASTRTPSPLWEKIIAKVSSIELLLDIRPAPGAPPEFGARYLSTHSQNPGKVLLPGIAILAEQAPEALHFLLLHEISHSVDPSDFPVPLEGPAESPWAETVRCLRGAQSVRARTGSPACFAASADKYEKMRAKEVAQFCQRVAEGLKENPDFTLPGYGCNCPHPQGKEAFADWLATEVLASMGAAANANSVLGWICGTYVSENERDQALAGTASGKDTLKSMQLMNDHSENSDRIEKIILAHPLLLQKLFPGLSPAAAYFSGEGK